MTITVTTGGPISTDPNAASFTYTSLISFLDTWLARNDVSVQASYLLLMTENYLNYGGGDMDPPLRVREMEATTTITPDATAYTVALPSDYLEYRSVVERASIRRPLASITPENAELSFPVRTGGLASHFYIVGEFMYPLPQTTNNIELTYYQKIPPLTSTNTTNWLLENNPSIYLRGALMMAADFIKDDAEFNKHAAFVRGLVTSMNRADAIGRRNRGGVMIRGTVP